MRDSTPPRRSASRSASARRGPCPPPTAPRGVAAGPSVSRHAELFVAVRVHGLDWLALEYWCMWPYTTMVWWPMADVVARG
eukprot:6135263-Prymnesium_polylepis.2